MPTVVFNGSPRENGNTVTLARAALREISGEKQFMHLYKMRIIPCAACGRCAHDGRCIADKNDDMPAIRAALENADRLLIASPLHFSSFTTPLIAAFSRLQPEWNRFRNAGKARSAARGNAAVALSGGGLYPNMFEAARIVAGAVLLTLGWRFAGIITASGTDTVPVADNPELLEKAAAQGGKMLS